MLSEPIVRQVLRYCEVTGQTVTVFQERRAFLDHDGSAIHHEWTDIPVVDLREGAERPRAQSAD